jgi:acyl-CoA dehydrogenase
MGHVVRNKIRTILLTATRGRLAGSPVGGVPARYWKKLAWASAIFAFMTDVAMFGLGAKLKFKEKIIGRFADVLSWMYLIAATLRRFEADGRREEDLPFLRWSMNYGFAQITAGFQGIFANMEFPLMSWVFRGPILWIFRMNPLGHPPSDEAENQIAELMQRHGEQRDRLFDGVFVSPNPEDQLHKLENAFRLTVESEDAFVKVRKALKQKKLSKKPLKELYKNALSQDIIGKTEYDSIEKAETARNDTIQVDSFSLKEYLGNP